MGKTSPDLFFHIGKGGGGTFRLFVYMFGQARLYTRVLGSPVGLGHSKYLPCHKPAGPISNS